MTSTSNTPSPSLTEDIQAFLALTDLRGLSDLRVSRARRVLLGLLGQQEREVQRGLLER